MSSDLTRREQTFERHRSSVRRPGKTSLYKQTKLIAYVHATTPVAVLIHSSLLSAVLQQNGLVDATAIISTHGGAGQG